MIRIIVVFDRAKLLIGLAKDLQKEHPNDLIYTQDLETAQMAVRHKAIDFPSQGIALVVTLPRVDQVPGDFMDIEAFAKIKPDLTIIIVMSPRVQEILKLQGKYDQGSGSQYLTLPVTTRMIDNIFFNQIL